MISACVCSTKNCTCGVYTSCPGAETLEVLLHSDLDDMKMEYKQWVVTDGATLMTAKQQSDKFIENFAPTVPKTTRHHYTATQEARYFAAIKINSVIRPTHNSGKLIRELFICTPRCTRGWGRDSH
jgi:hypothetical protein